jgi:hypothetical protein
VNDQRHRLDGPAIEHTNGSRAWYVNGQRHRTDGPAVEHANGDRDWCQNGRLHRTDGPAIERADGTVEYWIDNKKLTPAEFAARTVKELTVAEVEALLGHRVKIIS